MNQPETPAAAERISPFQFSLRSLLIAVAPLSAAIAFVSFNVTQYQQSRLSEHLYRHSLISIRPNLFPEGVLGLFFLAWVVAFVVCVAAAFKLRHRLLKYESALLAAVAFVAIVANAVCCVAEALQF
jgi:ABC-type transport system involved in cytochrome c biogenesis permease subunit